MQRTNVSACTQLLKSWRAFFYLVWKFGFEKACLVDVIWMQKEFSAAESRELVNYRGFVKTKTTTRINQLIWFHFYNNWIDIRCISGGKDQKIEACINRRLIILLMTFLWTNLFTWSFIRFAQYWEKTSDFFLFLCLVNGKRLECVIYKTALWSKNHMFSILANGL